MKKAAPREEGPQKAPQTGGEPRSGVRRPFSSYHPTRNGLLVLAPCLVGQVAGLHRASPSAALDKSSIVKGHKYYTAGRATR